MQKHAQKWSVLALLITTSGLLLSPAASLPQEDAQPPKEVKVEAAIHLLPGSLKERADSYLAPSLFSQPATPILTQVEKITAESNAQIAAERLQAAEEKAAQQKAAAEKAAAEKAAAEKAEAERQAAEKAAAEKAAAEKAQKEASQKASSPTTSRNSSRATSSSQTPSSSPSPSTTPTGAGIACGPRSGDPNLQAWPAQVRTRIASQFGVKDIGGYRATTSGEHGKGLALDVMTYYDSAKGAQILEWVKAHHKELNVYYVIWEQRIYGDWTGWAGKPMEDRGDRTANHFDHVHISFNSGSGTCPAS